MSAAASFPRSARALACAGLAWLALYALFAHTGTVAADLLFQVPLTVTLAVMVRVMLRRDIAHRSFWAWMAPGVALWALGDTLWAVFELAGAEPTPSPADACYLAGTLLVFVALVRGWRSWPWLRSTVAALDAGVLTAAILTIGFVLVIAPQAVAPLDAALALALAYNALDVVCVVLALLLLAGLRRGVAPAIALVAAALVVDVAGDAVYTWLAATDSYYSGHPVDLSWIVVYLLMAIAGLTALRAAPRPAPSAAAGERDLGLPLLLAGFAALAAFWLLRHRETATGVVVAAALVAVLTRLWLTARENRRMASELATAVAGAVTDPVTGLGTRQTVEDVLRRHAALPGGRFGVIVLEVGVGELPFEDRDAVMAEAAGRVRAVAPAGAAAGRTGACEITVVLPAQLTDPVRATGERLRLAIASEPFPAGAFGACTGVASAPTHGRTGEQLLRAAQAARDTARALGGNQVRAASDEVGVPLLETLADEIDARRGQPGHSRRVSRWAATVAGELGLAREERRSLALGGRLHDLALVAAPEALLRRPHMPSQGNDPRLAEHPLARLRVAPRIERLLGDDAASLELHHPLDGDPPLAARVVAVCNAWATLREGRPGRQPLGVEKARSHLLAGSGTTYSPDVVRAFLQLEARGEVGGDAEPARSPVATAGDILTATVANTAPAPHRAPASAPHGKSATRLLAGAIAIIVAWTGTAVTLQISAARENDRVVQLVKADRYLDKLELLEGRTLSEEVTLVQAMAIGREYESQLASALERGHASPDVRAGFERLQRAARVLESAAGRGSADAVKRVGEEIERRLESLDAAVDADVDSTQAGAGSRARLAWQLSAATGVLALLAASLLLVGFARSRRTAVRLRTAAARAEGERRALRDSDRRFRALLRHASDSVLVTDADGVIAFATDAVRPLLGHSPAQLTGRRAAELIDPRHAERLADLLRAARGMPDAAVGELTLLHHDGATVDAELRVADRLADPDVAGIVLTIHDVTERRRLESALHRSGLQDRLTGLPNRARFEEWLQEALARGGELAMLLIELDDLKSINDSLGHRAGDHCLGVWAERLRAALGGAGRLARLGGDQFGVLLDGVADLETAEFVVRRLVDAGGSGVELDGVELPLTAGAGVALAAPGDLAEDVLRSADTAVNAAKDQGSGHVVAFSPSMHARAVRQLELRAALAGAIEREEFELAYQPIVDLEADETASVEALLRWQIAGEQVSPADFIPIAEATGLIVPLGAWVLQRACADVAARGDLKVAVNVSAVQLHKGEVVEQVAAALDASGLAPERLVVELTESALMDDVEAARAALVALQELGVRIAIDDFGTGFSSLSMLADLPVDVLKLDRSFVVAMSGSRPHTALVAGVVSLADRLGLPVVAEGIETAAELAALRDLGCTYAQGFHLGRPGPLAAVDASTRGLR